MTASIGDRIAESILAREKGFVDHPSDSGGPTNHGVTEATARANGYHGPMQDLPRSFAYDLYVRRYFIEPGFDRVAAISEPIAAELADSGVNFGPSVPSVWFQRWLTAFNRQGVDYPDLRADGVIGRVTLRSLELFLDKRRKENGESVMVAALNCTQGNRYLELAERREKDEDFLFGWVRHRVLAPA